MADGGARRFKGRRSGSGARGHRGGGGNHGEWAGAVIFCYAAVVSSGSDHFPFFCGGIPHANGCAIPYLIYISLHAPTRGPPDPRPNHPPARHPSIPTSARQPPSHPTAARRPPTPGAICNPIRPGPARSDDGPADTARTARVPTGGGPPDTLPNIARPDILGNPPRVDSPTSHLTVARPRETFDCSPLHVCTDHRTAPPTRPTTAPTPCNWGRLSEPARTDPARPLSARPISA